MWFSWRKNHCTSSEYCAHAERCALYQLGKSFKLKLIQNSNWIFFSQENEMSATKAAAQSGQFLYGVPIGITQLKKSEMADAIRQNMIIIREMVHFLFIWKFFNKMEFLVSSDCGGPWFPIDGSTKWSAFHFWAVQRKPGWSWEMCSQGYGYTFHFFAHFSNYTGFFFAKISKRNSLIFAFYFLTGLS